MQQLLDSTQRAVLALALEKNPFVRMTMRGNSMAPALRDGMTLHVRAVDEPSLRPGQIAVFRSGGRLVAHRIVEVRSNAVVCAGDAQPDSLEYVPHADVAGVVIAYRTHAGGKEHSLESAPMRAYGALMKRTRRLRSAWRRANPALRAPVYRTLTRALGAYVRGDDASFVREIETVPPWKLASVARKHRCGALLCAAAERQDSPYAHALASLLRHDRWAAAVVSQKIRGQVFGVLDILGRAGIPALPLKGAARMFRRDDEWERFDACDIDVLVAQSDVAAAARALEGRGYVTEAGADEAYYARHHHAAPLHTNGGVPVEIHRALARADRVGKTWTMDELRPYITWAVDGESSAMVLDRAGSALHLALHGIHRAVLRDIVILAQELRRMNAAERAALQRAIDTETREGLRVRANVAFAAGLAGLHWPEAAAVNRFVEWSIEREDLPRPLRLYPECVDAWLSARGGRLRAIRNAALAGPARRRLSRALIRAGAAPAIALYLWLRGARS